MTAISPINVFTPAQEVKDIERFAGRDDELAALATALQSHGAQIVMYGQRGVGKSSLARQLAKLAVNDAELIARLKQKPFETLDFVPIYIACDDSIRNIEMLMLRLLSDEDALASWVPFKVVEKKTSGEIGAKFSVKVIELGGKKTDAITERAQEIETDIASIFTTACKGIVKTGVAKHGLLIIIDEFDRIKDRSGLASLLKALGPEGVTFALVGVATTIQDLVTEHESVARQLADGSVHIKPMRDDELQDIFDRAESLLEHKFIFNPEARTWIINIARGHPFYIHLVGKHALLKAIATGTNTITLEMAKEVLFEIALKGSAPIQESTYKTAIGHSYTREVILKRFAERIEDEIHTTELYAGISKELGIEPSTVSVYVGHLGSDKYGAVLNKTRERYYQFSDSMFKAYAAARPYELKASDQEDA
ncbi:MAG: ATP-binding protein [Gallionella sp.]|nr:ATP-binding protein [Gallionella sp.]